MRNGIKNNIPWGKEGLESAGEVSDGELAYPLIRKVQPDILITDIRIPFMDGLGLSELVKKEFPKIKIIILSGYNEFDYAKQATHIGVTDYLLKPITVAKPLEAMKKVADVIEKERENVRLMDKYHLRMAKNMMLERQRLLRDLVTGRINFREALERGEQVGMDLSVFFYQLILSKFMPMGSAVVYSNRVTFCQEAIEEWMGGRQYILVFNRGDGGWAFVLMGESEQEVEHRMSECAASLGKMAGACKDIQYFGGIGSYVNRLGDLQTSYLQVGRAFAARPFTEMNRIIGYSQIDGMVHGTGEITDINSVDVFKVNRKTLENFLRQGIVGKASGFVEEYFQNVGEKNCRSFMLRQYIVMDYCPRVSTSLEQLGLDTGRLPRGLSDMEKVLKGGCAPDMLKEKLVRLFEEVMTLGDSQTASKYSQVLDGAKASIYDNYAKEEISLNTVAVRINISPSYSSSIFSQEMGVAFVEFPTGAHMEKAKELLICSNLKTSEVGHEVGYKDSHYFGYLFKKTVGCTPKKYRAGSRKGSRRENGGPGPAKKGRTE